MRVLLLTSFHEHLPALAGFHLNWRAALSGQMVTLAHLSGTTRRDMLIDMAEASAFPSAEGLIVNPISIPTRFGTALPMMIHNYRCAQRLSLEFTHVCLASPYLYALQPRLDEAIAAADCGLPGAVYPMHAGWFWHDIAAGDPRLAALAQHLNTPLRVGRADGVYLSRPLFHEMLTTLHRFFSPEEIASLDPVYPLEEILFPTILPVLLGPSGRINETRARVWEQGDPITLPKLQAAIASGLHASGKRIPQHPSHPIRQQVLAHLPGNDVMSACLGTISV